MSLAMLMGSLNVTPLGMLSRSVLYSSVICSGVEVALSQRLSAPACVTDLCVAFEGRRSSLTYQEARKAPRWDVTNTAPKLNHSASYQSCVWVLVCVLICVATHCLPPPPPPPPSVSLYCSDLHICLCLVTQPLLLIDFSISLNQLRHLSSICCHISLSLIKPHLELKPLS